MKINEKLIPIDNYRRPNIKMKPEWLTIHSTGNPNSTAQNERDNLIRKGNVRQASFHLVVDDKEAIMCIPLNEVAWHAGDGRANGNMKSIGLEICESGNRKKTLANAAKLAAKILVEQNIPITKMVQHYNWSKKNCPRILRVGNLWNDFVEDVKKEVLNLMIEKSVIKFYDKSNKKEFGVDGYVIEEKTYVPARDLLEAIGFIVGWDNKKKIVTINK